MSKSFSQAPKPQPLPDNIIAAFERGGAGQDTQTHISPKVVRGKPSDVGMREPTHSAPDRPVHAGDLEPTNVGKGQPTNVGSRETTKVDKPEPTRRLSIDLPESWHRRFKTACSRTDRKMLAEVTEFIKQRTVQLENE